MERVTLIPDVYTRLPGTRCEVRWDGAEEITIYQRDGIWDLSPLVRPGRVLAWARLAGRPALGEWPLLPLPQRTPYPVSPGPARS